MGFPERLQSIIEERQISKYKIAKAIDISASTVSNYLKGKTTKQTFRSKQRMASNRRRLQIHHHRNRYHLHANLPGPGRQTHERETNPYPRPSHRKHA